MAEAEIYSVAHRDREKEDYMAVGGLLNAVNLEIEAGQYYEIGRASCRERV